MQVEPIAAPVIGFWLLAWANHLRLWRMLVVVRLAQYTGAFTMADMLRDARFLELQFLARLEREAGVTEQPMMEDTPHRRMLVHVLQAGYVNDVTRGYWHDSPENVFLGPDVNKLEREVERERWHDIARILSASNPVHFRIGHRGALRRAELEDLLKTGRSLEPFGVLLDGRYCDRDIAIALMAATPNAPVGVAFLDMNGVKAINVERGHEAGNTVIQTFLRIAWEAVEGLGEAYRVGGDEVIAVLQGPVDAMETRLKVLASKLAKERPLGAGSPTLTVAIGLAHASDATTTSQELRERADRAMYRAKAFGRTAELRASSLVVEDAEPWRA